MSAFGIENDDYDPFEDPGFKAWAKRVRTEMVPKMVASAVTMSIFTGKVDVKLAVEVGYALLLGKPFLIAVEPGAKVPDGLARAADAIVEVDMREPEKYRGRIREAIERVSAARGL